MPLSFSAADRTLCLSLKRPNFTIIGRGLSTVCLPILWALSTDEGLTVTPSLSAHNLITFASESPQVSFPLSGIPKKKGYFYASDFLCRPVLS